MNRLSPSLLLLAMTMMGCTAVESYVSAFEKKAAPEIQAGCAKFHTVEHSTVASLGISAAEMASGIVLAGSDKIEAAAIKSLVAFGDSFCALGPPPADKTTVTDQASWISKAADDLKTAIASVK